MLEVLLLSSATNSANDLFSAKKEVVISRNPSLI